MWLRDALPDDMPSARIYIYGYDTQLENSDSFQSIRDIGSSFYSAIRSMRHAYVYFVFTTFLR